MKIIDCHTHLGNDYFYNTKTDRKISLTGKGLIKLMKKFNVEKSIVFPCPSVKDLTCRNKKCNSYGYSPACLGVYEDYYILKCPLCKNKWKVKKNPYERENKKIIKIGKRFKQLIPFIILDPRYSKNPKNLNEYIKENIVGIKLHPFVTKFSPKELIKTEIMDIIKENNLILIFHSGEDKYSLPSNIIELAKTYSSVNFIIAHCARLDKTTLKNTKKMKNVFIETSLLNRFAKKINRSNKKIYEFLIKNMDIEKILFGTDIPYVTEHEYEEAIKSLNELKSNKNVFKKISSKNIEKIFNNC